MRSFFAFNQFLSNQKPDFVGYSYLGPSPQAFILIKYLESGGKKKLKRGKKGRLLLINNL